MSHSNHRFPCNAEDISAQKEKKKKKRLVKEKRRSILFLIFFHIFYILRMSLSIQQKLDRRSLVYFSKLSDHQQLFDDCVGSCDVS